MLNKRKKRRKKKKVDRADGGSNFFLAIVFAVMFVIVFTFHLFLSSTIEGLLSEQTRIEKEFSNIELEIKDSESDFEVEEEIESCCKFSSFVSSTIFLSSDVFICDFGISDKGFAIFLDSEDNSIS